MSRSSRARGPVLASLTLVAAAVIAGCGSSDGGGGATDGSGVEGTVTVGPTCPGPSTVTQSGDCTEPLATDLEVVDLSTGDEVARTTSDSEGHFRVDLPAGKYRISAGGDTGATTSVEVTVEDQGYSDAEVLVDSGVR